MILLPNPWIINVNYIKRMQRWWRLWNGKLLLGLVCKANVTKFHKLGSLKNRRSLSQSPEVWQLEIMLVELVPSGLRQNLVHAPAQLVVWAGNQASHDLEEASPSHFFDLLTVFSLCSGCFVSGSKVLFIIRHQSCCIRPPLMIYLNDPVAWFETKSCSKVWELRTQLDMLNLGDITQYLAIPDNPNASITFIWILVRRVQEGQK